MGCGLMQEIPMNLSYSPTPSPCASARFEHFIPTGGNGLTEQTADKAAISAVDISGSLTERVFRSFVSGQVRYYPPIPPASAELLSRYLTYRASVVAKHRKVRGFCGAMNPFLARQLGEYIDQHIGRRIAVTELAAVANCSATYFHRAFSATMNATPHNFLMERRISLARTLIDATDAPLVNIALTLGFNDSAHLSREFRRRVGECPSEWRRAQRSVNSTYLKVASA